MKRITLTFDNGPDENVTPAVLDLLREKNLKAHFFVLGKFLGTPKLKALVERAHDEGHVVSNHSFTHEIPLGNDQRVDAVEKEIVATEKLLNEITHGEKRFRPFGGGGVLGPHLLSKSAVRYLTENKYSCLLWNCVPRDWVDQKEWCARALADCETREHTVLVLHDIPNACLEFLDEFLTTALARNFSFVLELPDDCVPIRDGKIARDLSALVAAD